MTSNASTPVPPARDRDHNSASHRKLNRLRSAPPISFKVTPPEHGATPDFDVAARDANVFSQQLLRFYPNRHVQIPWKARTRDVIDFATNSPFNLNSNKEVIQGAVNAVKDTGVVHASIAAARAQTGMAEEISSIIAGMKGAHSRARIYPTTYAANSAAAAGLAHSDCTVVLHPQAHATLQSALAGAFTSGRIVRAFNAAEVATAIAKSSRRPVACVGDGLYSMGGFADFASLQKFLDVSPLGLVMVDDAHSVGLRGRDGRGEAMERMAGHTDRTIVTGSFGKAMGAVGGFMVGPEQFVRDAIQASVADRFSCNLDVAGQGATLAALRILGRSETLKTLQRELNKRLVRVDMALDSIGIKTEQAHTPIAFRVIYFDGPDEAIAAAGFLLEHSGFLTTPVYFPTIARGKGAIRISLSVGHTLPDIDKLLNALAALVDWRKAS